MVRTPSDQTIAAEAQARGLGYLAWSWSGNSDPILDMVLNFDPNQVSTWGRRIIDGPNGIKATSKEATIFGSPTPTVTPTVTPTTDPGGCTATYKVVGQWGGGFQGEVRVTASNSAIKSWTVTWTYANGQAVTNAWNATVTGSGSGVTARNMSYNGSIAAGGTTTFGFLGSWNGTNSVPTPSCTAA